MLMKGELPKPINCRGSSRLQTATYRHQSQRLLRQTEKEEREQREEQKETHVSSRQRRHRDRERKTERETAVSLSVGSHTVSLPVCGVSL
jgi:hypothetical protein